MAEETVAPVTTDPVGPPAIASASNETVKLESFDGDQAGVESALGIPPATTPAPAAPDPASSEVSGDGVSSELDTPAEPLPTAKPGDTPRVQDRINTLTRRNKDQEREITTLKAQVGVLTQSPEGEETAAPNLDAFGDDTKGYVEAVARWGAQDELRKQSCCSLRA